MLTFPGHPACGKRQARLRERGVGLVPSLHSLGYRAQRRTPFLSRSHSQLGERKGLGPEPQLFSPAPCRGRGGWGTAVALWGLEAWPSPWYISCKDPPPQNSMQIHKRSFLRGHRTGVGTWQSHMGAA